MKNRLAKAAKDLGIRMPQAPLLLAQERFLARLAVVDKEKSLVWKGGSLLLREYSNLKPPRFTADIDLTARGLVFKDAEDLIRQAAALVLDDGFSFTGITQSSMERDTPYGGERFELAWVFKINKYSEPLRVDLCAGDDVDPRIVTIDEVFLLDDEALKLTLAVYPPEFIFAEKLETMARFATGNTRLKDFIDLWSLVRLGEDRLPRAKCAGAIKRCFRRRKSEMDPKQWTSILRDEEFQDLLEQARIRNFPKLQLPSVPEMFAEIQGYLRALLLSDF